MKTPEQVLTEAKTFAINHGISLTDALAVHYISLNSIDVSCEPDFNATPPPLEFT